MNKQGRALRQRYNPGMNPFAPMPKVRFESRWTLGDPHAVYEFNVKIMGLASDASEEQWSWEVDQAREAFEHDLRAKYPWVGSVYFTGRSGGWLAVDDPAGKMTKVKLAAISKMVGAALASFKRHMVEEYPRGEG